MSEQRKALPVGTSTLDLALRMVEYLAGQSRPVPLLQIAQAFSASKATVYRHLVTLQAHGFVRQEAGTGRYEAGIKLVVLGEAMRHRFDIMATAHSALINLRDQTGQAVTLCTLVDDEVIVLELVQGRTIIEFATRPGTRLALHASAHGKVWLAFGPAHLADRVLSGPLEAWTPQTITSGERLDHEVASVRERGWASAPNEVLPGVNTIAAPVFDHKGALAGSVAIVGSTQFIAADPTEAQLTGVLGCAARISRDLGWKV